jgi:hypothetical protein
MFGRIERVADELKRFLAGRCSTTLLKDIASKMGAPAAKREPVAQLRISLEVGERRACSAFGANRTLANA